MDSLIHYPQADIVATVAALARTHASFSIEFTFAPRTPALTVLHTVGKLLPRADRAPAIIPASEAAAARRHRRRSARLAATAL